jgi:pimeloyl-ACP methyl ester carboxylesterase
VTTLAVDPRGFGESSQIPMTFGTVELGQDVAELVKTLGISRCDVFGISFGGMIATNLALENEGLVRRLVLASTPESGADFTPEGFTKALELGRCLIASADPKACLAHELSASRVEEVERVSAEAADIKPNSRADLLHLLAIARRHRPELELSLQRPRSLLIAGELDPLLPHAKLSEFSRRLAAEFMLIPDVGHDVVVEAPEAVAELVLEFISRPD